MCWQHALSSSVSKPKAQAAGSRKTPDPTIDLPQGIKNYSAWITDPDNVAQKELQPSSSLDLQTFSITQAARLCQL